MPDVIGEVKIPVVVGAELVPALPVSTDGPSLTISLKVEEKSFPVMGVLETCYLPGQKLDGPDQGR